MEAIPSNNPDSLEMTILGEKGLPVVWKTVSHCVNRLTVRVDKMEFGKKATYCFESNFKSVSMWKNLPIDNVLFDISICYNYYLRFFFLAIDPCQRDNGGCPSNSTVCNYLQPGKV